MNRRIFDTLSQYKKVPVSGIGNLQWNNSTGGALTDIFIYGNSIQHGTPSNSSPVEITSNECKYRCCGRNMWGGNALKSDLLDNGATVNYDGSITITAKMTKSSVTLLKTNFDANTPYTIILYGRNFSQISQNTCIKIEYSDNSTDELKFQNIDEECYCIFTTPQDKQIKRLVTYGNGEESFLYCDKCGLFKGTLTLDDFEDYFDGGTIVVPEALHSAKNMFNVWDVSGGRVIHNVEELIVDGKNVYVQGIYLTYSYPFGYLKVGIKPGASILDIISTHFVTGAAQKANHIYQTESGRYPYLFFEDTNITTAEEANAWFQSQYAAHTPVRIIRSIAEPFASNTEPQKLISPKGFGQIIEIGETLGARIEATYISHT